MKVVGPSLAVKDEGYEEDTYRKHLYFTQNLPLSPRTLETNIVQYEIFGIFVSFCGKYENKCKIISTKCINNKIEAKFSDLQKACDVTLTKHGSKRWC